MSINATYIHLVETNGLDHSRILAAFSTEDEANAYAGGLGDHMNARVRKIPLDPVFRDDWRTIVDLDRDGNTVGLETKILTGDGITQAFFLGEPIPTFTTRTRPGSVTYRNITMHLESEDTDEEAALQLARRIHRRAVQAGLWPDNDSPSMSVASGELQKILAEITANRTDGK